ncbi:MAG: trigger factor [Corallococcus sp.]|nr:trigger factor [Corallococcus sp.]
MKYTVEKKESKLTVKFVLKSEEWEDFLQKAYEHNKGKYNVPGFRKGHVPRKVLENTYGKSLFIEDALYDAASEYYKEFLDKNKEVEPVARPSIDEESIAITDKDTKFSVSVVVKPEIILGDYKGLTIEKTKIDEVKSADVDAELEKIQERNARYIEINDRAVCNGDEVTLDYSGSVDGVKFDGGTAENQTLVIGSHSFIEGFEEQLIGMNIGEQRKINVAFPAEYHASELAGKAAVFEVKIHAIKAKELPTIDDEFAKDVSEFATLKEYKASIKKDLTEERTQAVARKDESKLIETVVANAQMVIPEEMIEEQIDDYIEDFKYQLMYQGLKLEDYFKYTDSTMEDLRNNHKERAETAVRTRLVFEQIVKEEKLRASDKKIDEKIEEYAKQAGKDFKEFRLHLTAEQNAFFANQALTETLIDLLKKENTIA